MATRAYIVPVVGDGLASPTTPWRPAYVDGMVWGALRFGAAPQFLVAAEGTDAQHDAVAAQVPVVAFAADLGTILTPADAATYAAELEAWGIPGGLAVAGDPVDAMLRGIAAVHLLVQRLHTLGTQLLPAGVTLATTWGTLPAGFRALLVQLVAASGFNRGGVTDATTLGQFLVAMAAQWVDPIPVGPLVL